MVTGLVVFPTALILCVGTAVVLFWYLGSRRQPLRAAVYSGCILGIVRATVASAGWYTVEHTGGPLQVPAFALAMLAWPEAMVFTERRTLPAPPGFYLRLWFLLATSTLVIIALVGVAASLRRQRGSRQPPD